MLNAELKFPAKRKKVLAFSLQPSAFACSGFTLVELLVVLSIMGILAALAVPALKNFGHADAMTAADQQMLNDVARARQLAISQRTTVYMVFVPANFGPYLTAPITMAATNLCDKQLTGYTFASYGAVGDQPGQHQWHYLAPWQSLPDGTFIPQWKFYQPTRPFQFKDPLDPAILYSVYPFDYTNTIPFPAETNNPLSYPGYNRMIYSLPYLAFNYLGQLTEDGRNVALNHEFIPLARGSVLPAMDPNTRVFQMRPPQVNEVPPGNSTNTYNLIDIDPLTGRATLREPKLR